ncbi:uncharacterized protein VP01_627g4 [Puccinia sorghi]|uniref:Carboxypeptidase n=1 Tax=Puccinia sorghi TaxID=27349 RepID=A0A0L6UGE9_9BASI|nr:uncharacterized protein VP01_627g4 [Puccinia sorghi]
MTFCKGKDGVKRESCKKSAGSTFRLSLGISLLVCLMILHPTIAGKISRVDLRYQRRADVGSQTGKMTAASSVEITATPSVCPGSLGQSESKTGKNPDQAPLILWLNGGPGTSSMIDQPIGTGYSYGDRKVRTTAESTVELYNAIQLFLASPQHSNLIGRPFGVWTESYGGHYGPVLVDYILEMNEKLAVFNPNGLVPIPVHSLGIGNGLTNPQNDSHPYPPDLTSMLDDTKFKASIGVPSALNWTECNDDVDMDFEGGQGVEALTESLNLAASKSLANQTFKDWVVDGEVAGLYKTSTTLSYIRIFGAGHEVPAYGSKLPRGRAAKVFFDQTIANLPPTSIAH